MNLRTELVIPKSFWSLSLKDSLVTIGSCFAASVGKRLSDNKFQTLANPFGTTYHPVAIDRLLSYVVSNDLPPAESYVCRDDLWFSYDLHSSFFAEDSLSLREKIQQQVQKTHDLLGRSRVLLLTYGTAFLYEMADSGRPVANCHRMPAGNFRRRLTLVDEIVASFRETAGKLRSINPQLKIILTVSPVRHVKDTLQLNSVSKATLRLACHRMQETVADVEYFPSYELMLDDLRDYRFYQPDLIHPTPLAEDYVWKRFSETYFSEETLRFLEQWQSVQQALAHRSFHPHSTEHQAFLRKTLGDLQKLQHLVDIEKEITEVQSRLIPQPVS